MSGRLSMSKVRSPAQVSPNDEASVRFLKWSGALTFAQNAIRMGASVQMRLFERISARQGTPKAGEKRKKEAPREKKLAYQMGGRIYHCPERKKKEGEGNGRAVPGSFGSLS